MSKKVNPQNATIKTASVEIKVLTLNGKQVTLALFRQLPEKSLIDFNTFQLNGIPWGHINYHPDQCREERTHVHVLWQFQSTLYRSKIFKTADEPTLRQNAEFAKCLYAAALANREQLDPLRGWQCSNKGFSKTEILFIEKGDFDCEMELFIEGYGNGWKQKDHALRNANKLLNETTWRQNHPSDENACDISDEEIGYIFQHILKPRVADWMLWKRRYRELYEQLVDLDQLYIAV